MSLLKLSNELLLEIAYYLKWDSDINSLMQVSGRTYYLLTPWLYWHNVGWSDSTAFGWAVFHGCASAVRKALDAGAWTNIEYGGYSGPLHVAIRHGFAGVVKVLLEKGVDEDPAWMVGPSGDKLEVGENSPLYKALSCGYPEVLQVVLSHVRKLQGYDVGRRARPVRGGWHTYGITVGEAVGEHLMRDVAAKGDLDAVKFLARYLPSSVNSVDEGRDWTAPIIQAVRNNQTGVLRFLLDAGVDPGRGALLKEATPLYYAVRNGNVEAIQLLFNGGACPNPCMKHHGTKKGHILEILDTAVEKGHVKAAELLLKHINIKAKGRLTLRNWDTLMMAAVTCGLPDLVQDILEIGPKTYLKKPQGERTFVSDTTRSKPLAVAISKGHEDIVSLLIDCGADISDESGNSLLIRAVSKGYTDIAQLLLDKGIDKGIDFSRKETYTLSNCYLGISRVCTLGFAALWHAVPFPSTFQLLLDKGAQPGTRVEKLILATEVVRLGSGEVAQMLSEQGILLVSRGDSSEDGTGEQPVEEAGEQPDEEEVEQTEKQAGKEVGEKASYKECSIVQQVGPNSQDVKDIMLNALKNGDATVVNYLCEQGCSPNHKWTTGYSDGKMSSLEMATTVLFNHKDVATTLDVLLHHGADINQLQGDWDVNFRSDEQYYTALKLLVERGADPAAPTSKWGQKVLRLASYARLRKTTRFLLFESCDRGASLDYVQQLIDFCQQNLRKGFDLPFEKVLEDAYWRAIYPIPKENTS